jgi:hypothetical protein
MEEFGTFDGGGDSEDNDDEDNDEDGSKFEIVGHTILQHVTAVVSIFF